MRPGLSVLGKASTVLLVGWVLWGCTSLDRSAKWSSEAREAFFRSLNGEYEVIDVRQPMRFRPTALNLSLALDEGSRWSRAGDLRLTAPSPTGHERRWLHGCELVQEPDDEARYPGAYFRPIMYCKASSPSAKADEAPWSFSMGKIVRPYELKDVQVGLSKHLGRPFEPMPLPEGSYLFQFQVRGAGEMSIVARKK